MSVWDIPTRYSKNEVLNILRRIPHALAGEYDPQNFSDPYWSAYLHSMFTSIHTNYLLKSTGATDDLGNRWPDIRPKTKAYSRRPGKSKYWNSKDRGKILHNPRIGLPLYDDKPTLWGNKYRPTLTYIQDATWRRIFVNWLNGAHDKASAKAAAIAAWDALKQFYGATTLLKLVGDADLPILIHSGKLLLSVTPAPATVPYQPINADQIADYRNGRVKYGSRVPYKPPPGSMRDIIPNPHRLWKRRAKQAAIRAMLEHLTAVLRQGPVQVTPQRTPHGFRGAGGRFVKAPR